MLGELLMLSWNFIKFKVILNRLSNKVENSGEKLLKELKIFTLAESLGGVESLAELPNKMTHGGIPIEIRQNLGIDERLVRLSVGIEDYEDLENDLNNALEKVFGTKWLHNCKNIKK